MEKINSELWAWSFNTGNHIIIYRGDHACARFDFDNQLRITVGWTEYIKPNDWKCVLDYVKEAKDILKKIRKV